jgi:hypothetical protein
MNVTRDVILDLLPLYMEGEASRDSRNLVEEYLSRDPDLARRVRSDWEKDLTRGLRSIPPPELELQALRRTRRLLSIQGWLLGFGIGLTALALSSRFTYASGRLDFRFLVQEYPVLGLSFLVGLACWICYFIVRRRLRTRVN